MVKTLAESVLFLKQQRTLVHSHFPLKSLLTPSHVNPAVKSPQNTKLEHVFFLKKVGVSSTKTPFFANDFSKRVLKQGNKKQTATQVLSFLFFSTCLNSQVAHLRKRYSDVPNDSMLQL